MFVRLFVIRLVFVFSFSLNDMCVWYDNIKGHRIVQIISHAHIILQVLSAQFKGCPRFIVCSNSVMCMCYDNNIKGYGIEQNYITCTHSITSMCSLG